MMKMYHIIFHLITGRDIKLCLSIDMDMKDEAVRDRLVKWFTQEPVKYFFENGELVIINMDNVVSITVTQVKEG